MQHETLVYRPNHPEANENGMVPRRLVESNAPASAAPQIMKDIEPYRSVAADIATGGQAIIGGRAQHRDFLKRNGYTEVGNELAPSKREEMSAADRINDIKRALEE